jgi:hypothetical protein
MDVSNLTIPEIRALPLFYFRTGIPKGNNEMMVRAFTVLMEKSTGVVSVINLCFSHDSDGDAEDDKNRSQEVLN